jgi:flagellar biosynthesis protein FlhG
MNPKDQAQRLRELTKDYPAGLILKHYRKRKPPKIIAVASGRGGVGKSFLALNISCFWALRGKHVMLVDADFTMGHLDYLLGFNPKFTIQHLIEGKAELDKILIDGPWGLKLIPGTAGINDSSSIHGNNTRALIPDLAMHNDWADILICDTTSGVGNPTMDIISGCDELLLVTTPETGSVMDLYGMIKFISGKLDQSAPRMRLIVNRIRNRNEGKRVASSLRATTGRFLGKGLNILGFVYSDPAVEEATRKHIPFIRHAPTSTASRAIEEIAFSLLNEWSDPLVKEETSAG